MQLERSFRASGCFVFQTWLNQDDECESGTVSQPGVSEGHRRWHCASRSPHALVSEHTAVLQVCAHTYQHSFSLACFILYSFLLLLFVCLVIFFSPITALIFFPTFSCFADREVRWSVVCTACCHMTLVFAVMLLYDIL